MRIALDSRYKSVIPFELTELPQLVVVTGENGSGKSHLLEGIQKGSIKVETSKQPLAPKLYLHGTDLIPNEGGSVSDRQLKSRSISVYEQIHKELAKYGFDLKALERSRSRSSTQVGDLLEKIGKDLEDLTPDDIFLHGGEPEPQPKAFYRHNFAHKFKSYQVKRMTHLYREFLYEKYEEGSPGIDFIPASDYERVMGEPPWNAVNDMIAAANLGFQLTAPDHLDIDRFFDLRIVDQKTGSHFEFGELSSGEKVIMSLVLATYNARQGMKFPRLLLLDEPDASLHPSMTKQFLNVLKDLFINKLSMHVILTTHSPSTVALAPEDSIYVMDRSSAKPIMKSSHDRAIKALATGVPLLSFSYDNKRQVFVESKYDRMIYERLYRKNYAELDPEITLDFIVAGKDKSSGRDHVKDLVYDLTNAGNRTVLGVIDWDGENNGSDRVKVLGTNNRYSLDNYLLDPLLVGILLIRDTPEVSIAKIGLPQETSYAKIAELAGTELQRIADYVADKVGTTSTNRIQSTLINNQVLEIDESYLFMQGDDLYSGLRNIPEIGRYSNKNKLLKEVITKVVPDYYKMLSVDLLMLLHSLQDID